MPSLSADTAPQPCYSRNAFLKKGDVIGAFFLHSGERHFVWTFDPRLTPPLYWYEHQTRDLAIARFEEFLQISITNGFTLHTDGPPNNARLS